MRYIKILALLAIGLAVLADGNVVLAVNGTWTNAAGGSWPDTGNWSGGTVADGTDGTADFSTLELAADAIVTQDGARTIGNLTFGDTTPSHNWALSPGTALGAAGPLTLDAAGSPVITVNNGIASLNVKISGTKGFTKQGPGILNLNNPAFPAGVDPGTTAADMNDYSGNTVVAAGILRVSTPAGQQPTMLGAATVYPTPGTPGGSNQVIVNSGATLQFTGNSRVDNKEMHLQGTGVDAAVLGDPLVTGPLGAMYVNATGLANGTRIGNLAATNPAIVLDGNTTIRVVGTGAATSNNSTVLLGRTNLGGFTLTKTGAGRLSWELGGGTVFAGGGTTGTLHVVEGVASCNQANGLNASVPNVIVDAGAQIWGSVGGAVFNSAATTYTINGTMSVNARDGNSSTIITTSVIGVLNGSGTVTAGTFTNLANNQALAVNTLTVGHATIDGNFSGVIAQNVGSLNITKAQANTQILSGANTYNGTTTVNAGTLLVNGSHIGGMVDPFVVGSSSYTVAAAGTLGGTGMIKPLDIVGDGTPMISVVDGGRISPGSGGIGTLTLDGDTSINPLLNFAADADSSGSGLFDLGAAFASDKIALVNGAAGDVVFSSNVLNFNVLSGAMDGDYTLFTATVADAYSGLTIGGGGAITGGLAIGTGLDPGSSLKLVGNNIVVSAMVTPPPPVGVPGDYNDNGTVDAADYVVWRNAGPADTLLNDPTPGTVDQSDYDFWRSRFGATSGSGSIAPGSSAAVPEPASLLIALIGAAAVASRRRKRQL